MNAIYQIILVLHDKLFSFFLSGIGTFELIRQAINCCKEMCEITREKKLESSYLVPILEDGFLAASRGFLKSSIDHPAWFGLA